MRPGPQRGKPCHACGVTNPRQPAKHCPSLTCTWWRCVECDSLNDPAGRVMPGDNTPRRPAA